jgi:hypothetical protein
MKHILLKSIYLRLNSRTRKGIFAADPRGWTGPTVLALVCAQFLWACGPGWFKSGTLAWSNGTRISGVAGISRSSLNEGRVEVRVTSETYQFQIVGGGL